MSTRSPAARGERLGELQRAMQLMQRDVLEIAPRSVRDEMGDALPAMRIGTDVALELTRSGWSNPLGQRRSELQRVAYVARDDTLYRYYWNVLDRAEDTQPVDSGTAARRQRRRGSRHRRQRQRACVLAVGR